MDIDADNDNAVIRSRCRKQGVKMVIILSFRPNNTLSAQSVWFKFMYTFNRINFSTNSIELRIYTATIISVHASVISRKCCRIPFGVCGLVPLGFFWATRHISTQLHEFCPEFLNFLVGFVSTSFRFFCFKFIPHENELYTHTQPLCFVSPLILFCKFSRQILYVDVPAQNITNQQPTESVMLKANKCTDFYEIDFLRPFTDPWCLQPILEWIHRTKTEADVLWCVTQPSWICVEAKQSLLLWAVKESI